MVEVKKKVNFSESENKFYFGTEGVYESSVEKYFKNQVRLCLIGKLRHHNGIKNFDSHGHPHGSV